MALKHIDPTIWRLIKDEKRRQMETVNLIASENYASQAVLEALGSVLTNKYSEGYPGKRYYAGQANIDKVEQLTIARTLKLFHLTSGRWHVNVQPYSGSPANLSVYLGLAKPDETLIGMSLTHGGHLTHGHKVNFSGKLFNFIQYRVRRSDHLIDYDEVWKLAKIEKPKIIISGATAYPRQVDFKRFQEIAEDVGAIHMADISHIAGLIVAGVHVSPFPSTDIVTTTTHKTLRGPRSAIIICKNKFADAIDRAVFPGLQGGPHENAIAAIAVCLQEASQPEFKKYGQQIVKNAVALAAELEVRGYELVSRGTDNHLILVDLTNKKITGKQAQDELEYVGIIVNKNTIPYETRSPFDPSGIRLGTPAVTTRGMKEKNMAQIATLIDETLSSDLSTDRNDISKRVRSLAERFPIPDS